jgi:hypothetical protein
MEDLDAVFDRTLADKRDALQVGAELLRAVADALIRFPECLVVLLDAFRRGVAHALVLGGTCCR